MSKETSTITKSTISFKESVIKELKKNAVNLIKINQKNFYELGILLIIIKSMVGHSNFYKWLESKVNFSHNMANKFLKIIAKKKLLS